MSTSGDNDVELDHLEGRSVCPRVFHPGNCCSHSGYRSRLVAVGLPWGRDGVVLALSSRVKNRVSLVQVASDRRPSTYLGEGFDFAIFASRILEFRPLHNKLAANQAQSTIAEN